VYVIVTNFVTNCFDSVPFVIHVQGIPEINNVFTPNGDGVNDEFIFGEHGMKNIDVQIFNRWGQLVDSWNGENKGWDGIGTDGSALPESVYFYVLIADGEDGHYYEEKGSITLLR
jgi:gliding motility-associated-like protein